jgi:hypothetical protein
MGAHSSAESLMAGVESDAIRENASDLRMTMNSWLGASSLGWTPLDGASSDLVEWCRSARDVLEAIGRG